MATDFGYSNNTIQTTGPIRPGIKNAPVDVRIRVNTYADISTIPSPYVGMVVTVLADENTDGTMKDYKVKSLKASALGIADSLVDEVVPYADYLGVSGGSSADLTDYATKTYVDTEINNIEIPTKVSELQNDKNYLTTIPSEYVTETEMNEAINNIVLDSGNITFRDIEENEIFISSGNTVVTTYGNIVLSNNDLSVNENDNATFTVKLDKAPSNNQTINISINNSYCSINPSSLTFTSSNYSRTQTVTVTGVHDSTHYSNKNSVITLSSTNVTSKTITVTINNIDTQPSGPDPTVSVQSISLNKTESTLNVNDTEQLTVTFNPTNATNQNVTWISSDDTKATVVNGLVTGIASGSATITATSEDEKKSASCSYTVQEQVVTPPVVTYPTSLKMFLNGEGGSERYDESDALIWLDQTGNGKNYTFVSGTTQTNDKIIEYLWPEETNITLSSGIANLDNTAAANNNDGLTSMNFTWDIKLKYNNTAQQVILGNGTNSNNAANAFAITTSSGNITIRGNYDKLAIVNGLTTTMTTGNFYRITVTNDGSICKLYLDGVFITSCDSTAFTSIKSGVLHTNKTDYSYIKYYDKALTETEIQGGVQE